MNRIWERVDRAMPTLEEAQNPKPRAYHELTIKRANNGYIIGATEDLLVFENVQSLLGFIGAWASEQ